MKETVTMVEKPDLKHPNREPVVHQIRRERGGTMLRVLGAAQKREVKATKNLSIIVLFFMICWLPLYTVNCINAFCDKCLNDPILTYFCIILSHLNSALNPILYAYHLRDFRKALKMAMLRLCGIKPPPPQPADAPYRVSLINQKRALLERRTQSQPRIFMENSAVAKSLSPSPRAKHSCLPSSIASLTVDTHLAIWHLGEAATAVSPIKRMSSFDESHSRSYLSTKLRLSDGELDCLNEENGGQVLLFAAGSALNNEIIVKISPASSVESLNK